MELRIINPWIALTALSRSLEVAKQKGATKITLTIESADLILTYYEQAQRAAAYAHTVSIPCEHEYTC